MELCGLVILPQPQNTCTYCYTKKDKCSKFNRRSMTAAWIIEHFPVRGANFSVDRWKRNFQSPCSPWLQFSEIQMFSIFIIREINFSLPDGHTWIECVINVKKYLCLDKLSKFITVNAYNGTCISALWW